MAKKQLKASGGYEVGRLVDQSGGMVDEVVHPTLLQDSEAALLKNVSLDEKGTIKPCLGRIERFVEPFDTANPCNGIYPFYPDTTTSRLIIGAGGKLYSDTPHLVTRWAEQSHFEEQGSERINCDTTTKPGEIRVKATPKATFTRSSKAYQQDGSTVDNDKPRFVSDNLALGKTVTTNGTVNKGALGMVTDGCILSLSDTHLDVAGDNSPKYVQVDLGEVKKISEIVVWHYYSDERTYNNTRTEVSEDGFAWESVFDSSIKGTYKESAGGHRITFDVKKVRYIRDWLNGSSVNQANHWVEIQALGPLGRGLLVEEGTENLITADKQKFAGWTAYSGATVTLAQDQVVPEWNTDKATKIKTSGGTHPTKYFLNTLGTSISGQSYTFSVKIKNIGSKPVVVNQNVPGSVTVEPGETKTATMSGPGNGVSAWQPCFSSVAASDSLEFLVYQPMAEKKAYATTFTDGTRAAENLHIPASVLSTKEGTVRALVHVPEFWKSSASQWRRIWSVWKDAENGYYLCYHPAEDKMQFGILASGAESIVLRADKPSVGLHLITARWAESECALVIDGVERDSVDNPVLPTAFPVDKLYIGSRGDGDYINAILADMDFSSVARTDAEDLTAFQSEERLPVDEYTTAKMSFDGNINVTNGGFVWISDKKDMTNVQDTETGKVEVKVNTPGESFVVVQTRSGDDGVTWDNWQPVYADGTIQSVHKNYIQVKAIGHATETDKPSVQELILSYDGDPAAAELDTGLSPGGQWYFATLLSKCVMTNKLDPPKVWDGNKPIEILKGSPPHAQYITAHKNYLFMAGSSEGPSRLYFSEVLNIESWPVLNFIDVSPNDGDWITGLLPYDDYLIITKNRSVWLLVGSGPSDFEVRRIHDGIGCVAPRSLVKVVDSFAFASTEGIYLSDISTPTLISERLKETWKKMNRRRLHQIAGEFYDHKLRMDMPFGSSTVNNIRIIYDSIRKCLYLQEMSAHASCYAKYSEAGQEVLLFGHAGNGQVSHADTGTSDAGQPITMEWGTKHFNFGSSAIVKKARNLYFVTIPPSAPVEVQVYLIVDGEEMPTPLVFTVEPGKTVYKLKPRTAGVRNMRSLGYRVVQAEASGGVRFHELIQEYLMKKVKPS